MMLKITLNIFMALFLIFNVVSCDNEDQKTPESGMYVVTINKMSVDEVYNHKVAEVPLKSEIESSQVEDECRKGIIPIQISSAIVIPADATISYPRNSSVAIININSLQKRYEVDFRILISGWTLCIYDVSFLYFNFHLTIDNQSSNELLISRNDFWMEDRDVNAVYQKYMIDESVPNVLPVKILPNGVANANIWFDVGPKPTGKYKLIANLNGTQIVVDLPKYEFDKEGHYTSG